jgi:hypothetical protein
MMIKPGEEILLGAGQDTSPVVGLFQVEAA